MFKLKNVVVNGGATLNKNGSELSYKQGYQVSKQDLEVIPLYKLRKSHLIEMLETLEDGECLGIWIENRKVYIDCSERLTIKRKALSVGRKRNQISIFNWKNGEVIYCR